MKDSQPEHSAPATPLPCAAVGAVGAGTPLRAFSTTPDGTKLW
jgi:hypothetical protein